MLGTAVIKQVAGADEMQTKGKALKQESFKSEKSPFDVKKTDFSGKGGSGRKDAENKNVMGSLKKASRSDEKVVFK